MTPTRRASEGIRFRDAQHHFSLPRLRVGLVCAVAWAISCIASADEAAFNVEKREDRFIITHGERPVATYVFRDDKILRPYFAHVHAPDGTPVTRHHPPRPGIDAVDHDTMHPCIWLAFGELSESDFWRNKGRVEVEHINDSPRIGNDFVSIVGYNRYRAGEREVAVELFARTVRMLEGGYLLQYDSTFYGRDAAAEQTSFGDQEEMGLGLRLATPLVVKGGSGKITNSAGGKNEAEVWGKQADWCDYSGIVEKDGAKRRVGMLLIPHKDNFRRSWFHARDYGLLVANPFGQNAFTKGEKSRIEVKPGERLDLRFGVWIYSVDAAKTPDYAAIAAAYHKAAKGR